MNDEEFSFDKFKKNKELVDIACGFNYNDTGYSIKDFSFKELSEEEIQFALSTIADVFK